jgi:ABC-2 type transport system permease protein
MTWAMFRVMALELWRDRGALVMAFLLPPLVFLIFSAVFSGTTGEDVKLKVAVADIAHTEDSRRLLAALVKDPDLRAEAVSPQTLEEVRRRVKSSADDAGLVIRADPGAEGSPLVILADPSRAVAAPLVQARTQQVLARAMPDLLLGRTVRDLNSAIGDLTPEQETNVSMARREAKSDAAEGKPTPAQDSMFERQAVSGAKRGGGTIVYYAGAVPILFSLFTAMHGALSLIEERRAGIADRIMAGRAGMGPVVGGKFAFLLSQSVVQATSIFVTAEVVYGIDVLAHLPLWLTTTAAASVCSAGLALGLVSVCRTREQAQMLSTFVILVLAAIGGSMVPRFLMPPWLQQVGWATPHAWVIDAYQGALWRDEGPATLYRAWLVLAGTGALGLLVAQLTARYARR